VRLNRNVITLVALAGVLALCLLGYTAFAGAEGEPGGSGDPLVAQSYVDQYVKWQVAELRTGQVLAARTGAEFIVRRGQVVAVDATGNGIPDVTGGADISNGSKVPLNHLLVFPREDGRGIKALAPAVVMYRGGASQ